MSHNFLTTSCTLLDVGLHQFLSCMTKMMSSSEICAYIKNELSFALKLTHRGGSFISSFSHF